MIIVVRLDAKKIDKSKLAPKQFQSKGQTIESLDLDLVLIPTPNGTNHYLVKQGTSADDKTDMPIIGSANEKGQGAKPPQGKAPASQSTGNADDDVPF
jgi:hypothetical protein